MTIAERARESQKEWSLKDGCLSYEQGYLKGANEQQTILLCSICEWLKDNTYLNDDILENLVNSMEE